MSETSANTAPASPSDGSGLSGSGGRAPRRRPPLNWPRIGMLLAIVFCVGLPIRLIVINRSVMVSRDTVTFIWYAQALADDPLDAMKRHDQHPLYPAAVLAAHGLLQAAPILPAAVKSDPIRSWTGAAITVSLLGGLALIVAVYLLTSSLFDPQIGLAAAILAAAAAEFCQLSADGLTDMPHLAIYLTAVWAGVRGFQTQHHRWFLLAGLLAGMNYLIRPEGAEPAVVVAGLLCSPYVCSMSARKRAAALCCVLVGAVIVASPYMMTTGKLVRKKSVWKFLQKDAATASLGEPAAFAESGLARCAQSDDAAMRIAAVQESAKSPSRNPEIRPAGSRSHTGFEMGSKQTSAARTSVPRTSASRAHAEQAVLQAGVGRDVPRAAGVIAENWARSLRVTYLVPLLAWLVWRKRFPADRKGGRIVQAAVGLHAAILVALIVQFDYWSLFSLRHVMVFTGLTLPFAAAGMAAIIESLPERRQGWAALLLGFGLVAPTLPWMFEVRHREDAHFRSAATWIHQHSPERPSVLTERFRVAFYADADYIAGPLEADAGEYLARAREARPDWIVFDERRILKERPDFFTELEQALGSGESLELARVEVNQLPRGPRRVLVYEYRLAD